MPLKILRIEIDRHFHGSNDVPRPWVARIDGVDGKFGLARTFVQKLNDYRNARRSMSGRLGGLVAAFPLHDGVLYEVSRLRGSSSKRHVAREFGRVVDGKFEPVEPVDVLTAVECHPGPAINIEVSDEVRVSRLDGLGTPASCGFVPISRERNMRLYHLRAGAIHEFNCGDGDRYLVIADGTRPTRVSQADALRIISSGLMI